jgi:hypothetical protein
MSPAVEARLCPGTITPILGVIRVVAAWLGGTIVNLLTYSGYYDIVVRDFRLMLGAVALARLGDGIRPLARMIRSVSELRGPPGTCATAVREQSTDAFVQRARHDLVSRPPAEVRRKTRVAHLTGTAVASQCRVG